MIELWPENFIFMPENEISLHEKEKKFPQISWMGIPCIKLCTAKFSMTIFGARKIIPGANYSFSSIEIPFSCMKMSFFLNEFFMPRYFRDRNYSMTVRFHYSQYPVIAIQIKHLIVKNIIGISFKKNLKFFR